MEFEIGHRVYLTIGRQFVEISSQLRLERHEDWSRGSLVVTVVVLAHDVLACVASGRPRRRVSI